MDIQNNNLQYVLYQIANHCPEAMIVYLHIFNRTNSFGKAFFTRDLVENDMCESWCKFKNGLRKLAKENILEWHYANGKIAVTLLDTDSYD